MTRHLKIVRTGREVALVDTRQGRSFLMLLILEAAIFTLFAGKLASVASGPADVLVPFAVCAVVMIWTARHVASDVRLGIDPARRRASVVEISPLSGRRTIHEFAIDDVERLAVRQLQPRTFTFERRPVSCEFALELRDGNQLVVARRAPLFACRETVSRFAAATGLGTRIERLAN